jgi:TraX protein
MQPLRPTIPAPPYSHSASPILNYYDLLKIIAIGAMIVDHLNDYCGVHSLWLTAVGRVAMPLFLFLVGFNRSSRIGWPLVCGFLCVLPVQWELRGTLLPLNILFPIGLSRFALGFYERLRLGRTPWLELTAGICALCAAFTSLIWEYGTIAFLWAWFGRLRRDRHPLGPVVGAVGTLLLMAAYWPLFGGLRWLLVLSAGSTWCILCLLPIIQPIRNFAGHTVVRLISRKSLLIYVAHLAIILLVRHLVTPVAW